MSSIDQVIAAARRGGGGFSKRKRFTLARSRAIEKMRKFALADPYFYVLELIQAAIANGASYIDLACESGNVTLSYVGGGLDESQLGQLFDFLFASKERLDIADLRALALGVNAALLFEPTRVIIESGDGTAKGTTRMVLEHGADAVDVGRADRPLGGTFIRFEGLRRDVVAKKTGRKGNDDGSMEYGVVETRCLAAPIPIIFNGTPMFGFRKSRIPGLFGYQQALGFDEGDLYGIIGKECWGVPSFQLLTWGVWVQSFKYELIKGQKIGGIVCFDRLHKTADHSGFVQDGRMEEMWLRLRPYARQLISGKQKTDLTISTLDGEPLSTDELRQVLAETALVVAISPKVKPDSEAAERARAIARALDGLPLRIPDDAVGAVRVFGGREREVVRPRLDEVELRFYTKDPLPLPAEPWLVRPLSMPDLDVKTVAEDLAERFEPLAMSVDADADADSTSIADVDVRLSDLFEELAGDQPDPPPDEKADAPQRRDKLAAVLAARLGPGPIRASIYLPEQPGRAELGMAIDVVTVGRSLSSVVVPSAFSGHVLRVEVPGVSPTEVLEAGLLGEGEGPNLAQILGEHVADRATATLASQTERVLEGLSVGEVEPGGPAARLALAALARTCTARLRTSRPGRMAPGASFSLRVDVDEFDPLELRLLRTQDGTAWSLRELALRMDEMGGLVYGTNPVVPGNLDGLDRSRVLDLDSLSERLVISLVGESCYVRVDGRDVLAEFNGTTCRDMAIGLREYPDFPLLVEGVDPSGIPRDEQERCLERLLAGLRSWLDGTHPQADSMAREHWLEGRRQALRHLQWFVCRRAVRQPTLQDELTELKLFPDQDHQLRSLSELRAQLRSAQGALAFYEHSMGVGLTIQRATTTKEMSGVAVSPFLFRLLLPLGNLRLAFDFDVDDSEAQQNPTTPASAFLCRSEIDTPLLSGVVGVPSESQTTYRLQVRDTKRQCRHVLQELATEYGVVGVLQLGGEDWDESQSVAWRTVEAACRNVISQLLDRLPSLVTQPKAYLSGALALLEFAARQLQLTQAPDGHSIDVSIRNPLAERVLGLPLFPTGRGTPTSAHRLIEQFCRDAAAETETSWRDVLAATTAPVLLDWLERNLSRERVLQVASWTPPAEPAPRVAEGRIADDVLAYNIEHWMHVLRPDKPREAPRTRVWLQVPDIFVGLGGHGLVMGGERRIDLDTSHPLVARARDGTPESLAWVLLACYAYLNAELHPVSNAHELGFQRNLIGALGEGGLVIRSSPEASSAGRA
jgi:hypothetical protein